MKLNYSHCQELSLNIILFVHFLILLYIFKSLLFLDLMVEWMFLNFNGIVESLSPRNICYTDQGEVGRTMKWIRDRD